MLGKRCLSSGLWDFFKELFLLFKSWLFGLMINKYPSKFAHEVLLQLDTTSEETKPHNNSKHSFQWT